VRALGLDVHRDFCEVAIAEREGVRLAGRVKTTPEDLELFAQSLDAHDHVALEVTGNCWEIARIIEPHVARVTVVSPSDTGISAARAKTDRLDALRLAKLLWAGQLDAVWRPDERTRAMRRRLARRSQLVRARTRAKNEIHAALLRCLKGKPPMSDLFGVKGRRWLGDQPPLPVAEQETVEAALRQVEFLDAEIAAVERLIAADALNWPEVKRLMTVPGVNVVVAATFAAAVGDIRRFPNPRQLTGYLGLDPKVRQSGSSPGTRGRVSKQGSASAPCARRGELVDGAPAGPDRRLLYARQGAPRAWGRDRRGRAQARLPVLVLADALRGLRLCAAVADEEEDAPARAPGRRAEGPGRPLGLVDQPGAARRRARARAAGAACLRAHGSPTGSRRKARVRQRGAHQVGPRRTKSRGRPKALDLHLDTSSPAPAENCLTRDRSRQRERLDFHPSPEAAVVRIQSSAWTTNSLPQVSHAATCCPL
jgi:transposase